MLVHAWLVALSSPVILGASFTSAVVFDQPPQPPQVLQQYHEAFLMAVDAFVRKDMRALEQLLETQGRAIQGAFDYDLVANSLLYMAIFEHRKFTEAYQLLARYGVEMGGSKAFIKRLSGVFWVKNIKFPEPGLVQEVVQLGLLRLEDFWSVALLERSIEIFHLLRENGADVEHRIVVNSYGDCLNVLGFCVAYGEARFLEELLDGGANVDSSPNSHFKNLWHFIATNQGKTDLHDDSLLAKEKVFKLLPRILEQTRDIFSPFLGNSLENVTGSLLSVDKMLSQELTGRLVAGTIDLNQFGAVDELGWTLLDRVCLMSPASFPLTIAILVEAEFPTKVPLVAAYYARNWTLLRKLINSGSVDYNERLRKDTNILMALIKDEDVEERLIEEMIDRGAEVYFPSELSTSNAYICALTAWRRGSLSRRLMNKIESKLTPEELMKAKQFKEYISSRRSVIRR